MNEKLTRRTFVAGAAVLGGTLALTGCGPVVKDDAAPESDAGSSGTPEADVVVLGAGLAGLGAAGAAALGGAKVTLVEKGTTLLSAFWPSPGNLGIAQLPENQASWVFVSDEPDGKESFQARWKERTDIGHRDVPWPDYERMTNTMIEACNTVAWVEGLKLPFEKSMDKSMAGVDGVKPIVPEGSERTGGQHIGDVFDVVFQEKGTTVLFESAGTELVVEDGKVVGVVVEGPNGTQTIRTKAVVLATGGYAGSDEYRKRYIPEVDEAGYRFVGLPLNTGDSMTMAAAAGAALYDDGWIIPSSLVVSQALADADGSLEGLSAPQTGLYVDATGTRFVNEAAGSTTWATTMVDSKRGPYFVLFDSSDAEATAAIEKGLTTGEAFKGATIEELATAAGMTKLAETFTAYGALVTSGVDVEFGKPADEMAPYGEGPYYLVRFVPSYVATMGGVRTDANCQAIDAGGAPIAGLFVVGESTHRFLYNRSFLSACSNGSGITMGRLTGEFIVSQLEL